jgi:hypothetical protein
MHNIGEDSFQELTEDQLRFLVNQGAKELVRRDSPRMKYWIVTYDYRGNINTWLHYSPTRPLLSDIMPCYFEHDNNEYLSIDGPHEMWNPQNTIFTLFFDSEFTSIYQPPHPFSVPFPEGYVRGEDITELSPRPDPDMCPACGSGPVEESDYQIECHNCHFIWAEN